MQIEVRNMFMGRASILLVWGTVGITTKETRRLIQLAKNTNVKLNVVKNSDHQSSSSMITSIGV